MMATVAILICFVLVFTVALMVIIPVVVSQLNEFGKALPEYLGKLQELIASPRAFLPDWVSTQIETVKQNITTVMSEGAGFIGVVIKHIWASGRTLLDVFSSLIVTPVVAFYILTLWNKRVKKYDSR